MLTLGDLTSDMTWPLCTFITVLLPLVPHEASQSQILPASNFGLDRTHSKPGGALLSGSETGRNPGLFIRFEGDSQSKVRGEKRKKERKRKDAAV